MLNRWVAAMVGLSVWGIGCGGAPDPILTTVAPDTDAGDAAPMGTDAGTDGGVAEGEDAGQADGGQEVDGQVREDAGPDADARAADAAPEAAPTCVPHCPVGVTCGVASDGCGGQMQCGTCSGHETCGGGGRAGVCGCTPVACSAGQSCGSVPDNCGGTVSCGSCSGTDVCEKGSCESWQNIGCFAAPSLSVCANNLGPGDHCAIVTHNGGQTLGYYVCPASVTLPSDLCTAEKTIPNTYDCCTQADCQ